MKAIFLRALEADDKAGMLLAAIQEPEATRGKQRFDVEPASFSSVPGSPFAYWVSEKLRGVFRQLKPFETDGRTAKQGLATADDFRFIRAWWEVLDTSLLLRWFPIVKGGAFAPFYTAIDAVIHWESDGHLIKAWAGSLYNESHWSRILKNTDLFFRPGLTWPLRGVRFSAQAVPAGCIFSVAGKMAFVPLDMPKEYLALFNALVFDKFIAFFAGKVGGVQYEVGLIQKVPVPRLSTNDQSFLGVIAVRAWSLKRSLDTRTETSHAFTLPGLLQVAGTDLATRAAGLLEHIRAVETELITLQAELDERCFELYEIDEVDRRSITEGFGTPNLDSDEVSSDDSDNSEGNVAEDADENEAGADTVVLATKLVSWAVGVAFGRFDVRLATGACPMSADPEPFDPLPTCSPGMLTGTDGLPLARPPTDYPLNFPDTGVLVDDPGHGGDLTLAVRAMFDVVFGADADRWWNDVAALLDPKGHDPRVWLAGSFFEHHLKRYSKSRRKAPIFWQLGTPSGRYSVWLYVHRLTRDSFIQLQNEVIGPKLAHEERKLTNLIQTAGGSPSASQRKEIAAQEVVIEELRAMLDDVKRVAPLWNPNLDDGVVLTMAPLWRLVSQYKPWQKELKAKWDELSAGKYDWSHIAMHLWPERVVPKCATDRSLAIAHGLESEFWIESTDGKWKPQTTPLRSVDELVRERSSLAVKAALKSLLDVTGGKTLSRSSRSIGSR